MQVLQDLFTENYKTSLKGTELDLNNEKPILMGRKS